jgi:hypothetical protein
MNLDFVCLLFTFSTTVFTMLANILLILARGTISDDYLSFSLQIITDVVVFFSFSFRMMAEIENYFTSSQRIYAYTQLESEDELVKDLDK